MSWSMPKVCYLELERFLTYAIRNHHQCDESPEYKSSVKSSGAYNIFHQKTRQFVSAKSARVHREFPGCQCERVDGDSKLAFD